MTLFSGMSSWCHADRNGRSVEKGRQRRSRPLAMLTYFFVRSARPSGCGLAGRAFLNTPNFFVLFLVTHMSGQKGQYLHYSISDFRLLPVHHIGRWRFWQNAAPDKCKLPLRFGRMYPFRFGGRDGEMWAYACRKVIRWT